MLKNIPYDVLKKDELSYDILLCRDIYNNTYTDIAKKFGISVENVIHLYNRLKFKQICIYIDHISVALGYDDNSQVRKIYERAEYCYQDRKYACAYLEKKYKEILSDYRNGEPGMPTQFIKNMPPLRRKLTKDEVKRVVEMREKEKASFSKIAQEFRITQARAKHTYDWYYHVQVLDLIKDLLNKAENHEEKMNIWRSYFGNNFSSKRRYDMLAKK